MNKAVDMLKQGDLDAAVEALTAFNNKDSKVSSAAANNLAFLNLMVLRVLFGRVRVFNLEGKRQASRGDTTSRTSLIS